MILHAESPNVKSEILVFKTNASRDIDKSKVSDIFKEVKGVVDWNFDFEDRDHIFRVVSMGIMPEKVIQILGKIGIKAIELTD